MFANLGIRELVVIAIVGIVIFGFARIPDLAQTLGKGFREYKKTRKQITGGLKDITDDFLSS